MCYDRGLRWHKRLGKGDFFRIKAISSVRIYNTKLASTACLAALLDFVCMDLEDAIEIDVMDDFIHKNRILRRYCFPPSRLHLTARLFSRGLDMCFANAEAALLIYVQLLIFRLVRYAE